MNKPRSTLSKSLFYLFDLYLVILMVVELIRCISLREEGSKDCNFALFGWCCSHVPVLFFFIYFCSNFVPNLLRKAVKLEGTQEGIVGTKHSREQLDVSYKKKKKKSLHSFIPHFYPYHQCADR